MFDFKKNTKQKSLSADLKFVDLYKKKEKMHRPSLVAPPRQQGPAEEAQHHMQLQHLKQMNLLESQNSLLGNSMGRGSPSSQGARMNQSAQGSRLLPRGHPLAASIFGGGFDDVVPTRGALPPSTTIPRPSNEVYQKSSAVEIE